MSIDFSTRSSRQSLTQWISACRSVDRLSGNMAAAYGPLAIPERAARFNLHCPRFERRHRSRLRRGPKPGIAEPKQALLIFVVQRPLHAFYGHGGSETH